MINKPQAVIFDTDNTLYPFEPAHKAATAATVEKAINRLGISSDQFLTAYNQARKEIKDVLGPTASSHSRLLYFQRTIEVLGMRTQILMTLELEQTYWRTFLSHCTLFPNVKEFLLELKSEGILTAVLTDLTAQIQFRKLIYFDLDELFDYVVTSEEAGMDKPDQRPFEITVNKLNVDPKNIWMVGDNPTTDMVGANYFGMVKMQKVHDGVVVHRQGDGVPDVTFHDFGELTKLFHQVK